jgi:hypothetical protein
MANRRQCKWETTKLTNKFRNFRKRFPVISSEVKTEDEDCFAPNEIKEELNRKLTSI